MVNLNKIFETLPKKGYVVIDFDNTCIINDIGEAVLAFLCEHGLLKKYDNKVAFKKYYHLLEIGQVRDAYEFVTKVLAGFTADEIRTIVQETVKSDGSKITTRNLLGIKINKGLKLNKPILKIIDFLHRGHELWVISASSKLVVEEAVNIFLPNYNIKCIGVTSEVNRGILTNQLIYPTSIFEGKVDCIKKYISKDVKPVVGIGDSMNDKEMLEYSKIKIVADRNNQLTELARKKGWIILSREC